MTPADVTVITATMPGREGRLVDCIRSVNAQTVQPFAHLIRCRPPAGGPGPVQLAEQRNALLEGVTTPWLAVLDDDDVWLPEHLAMLALHLDTADVIYSWAAQVRGAAVDVTGWPNSQLAAQLRERNVICGNSLIRTDWVRMVGGWGGPHDGQQFTRTGAGWEDHDMWIRLAECGCRFVCVPECTWEYRGHDQQSTRLWALR